MKYKPYLLAIALFSVITILLIGFIQFKESTIQVSFKDIEPIPPYRAQDQKLPLRIAMISVLNYQDTSKYQKQLAQSLGRALNRQVLVMHRKRYSEINQLLVKGEADLGLLSTGAYCVYNEKNNFQPLVMQERHNVPYYYSYVIVPADSSANNLEDLRGKRFAFMDPLSYSGYLSIQERLVQSNENAKKFFDTFYFSYSHDASIRAVLDKQVDGAVVDSLAYDYVKKYRPSDAEQIKIVDTLPPRGTGPIVARQHLQDTDKIQRALLNLHHDPIAREAMDRLMIDRFIIPKPELYPAITWRETEAS